MNIPNSSGGFFSLFNQQISVFKELARYATIDDEAMREFIRVLHASKGGSELFAQLAKINRALTGMLNCLGQGFFSFDSTGMSSKIASKACLELLETDPSGKPVWEVLKIEKDKIKSFQGWMALAFKEDINFDSIAEIGMRTFPHSQGRTIALNYFPMRGPDGKVTDVLVVATDHTEKEMAARQAELERRNVEMINKIVAQRKSFLGFVSDLRAQIANFRRLSEKTTLNEEGVKDFMRFLHTMKGGSSMFAIDALASAIHDLEDEWGLARTRGVSSEELPACRTIIQQQLAKIEERLESFLQQHRGLLGEAFFRQERMIELPLSRLVTLREALSDSGAPQPILEEFTELAKEPVEAYVGPFLQVVEQVACAQSKEIRPVNVQNGGFRIYPEAYKDLLASFVHLFRNAIDHGIETPEKRFQAGKDPVGTIEFRISPVRIRDGDWVEFVMEDDGQGIDPAKVREVLRSRGMSQNPEALSDEKTIQCVFEPGFSTRTEVTAISGRGIGLDAVKACATAMGGSVRVESTFGKGARFTITVPQQLPFERETGSTRKKAA